MSVQAGMLILSGIGTVLGFMGGRRQDQRYAEMAEAQYEQDKINYEFSWQEAQDAYTYSLEDRDLAEFNLEQQRIYRDQTAINEWIDKDRQRMFDYNNQVDAYNAGVESYKTQLDFNQVAADMTENAARRSYQEQLIQMGFQLEDLTLQTDRKARGVDINRKQLKSQRKEGIRTAKINKASLKNQLAAKKADYTQKIEAQRLQGIEGEGQIRAYGQTGRSGRKNRLRALQNSQRLEDALQYAYSNAERSTGLDIKAINTKLEALGDRLDLQDEAFVEDLYNTRVDQDFNERQLSEQLKSTNLEYEFNQEKQKLDRYSVDLQARERLNPKPVLAPQLSKPLELPEPVLQKPRAPRKGPKPRKYIASSGHGLAALASGMSSFGSALANFNS